MYLFKKRYVLLLTILTLGFLTYACSDSSTGPDPDNGNDPSVEFNSKAAPGDSAKSFLEGDQYSSLQIEIDYMPGHAPTQGGLDRLKTFLEQRLNKSSITFLEPTEIPSGNQDAYSSNDVRDLEKSHRNNFTEAGSNTLHAYFLILDGEFEQSNVLGIAYWNTSMAFFGKTIEDVSGNPPVAPSEEQVEGTVFRHEVGHNLGLVGIGSPHPEGQEPHETDGSAHCTVDGCLMEPAVETANFFQNLSGETPDLDPLCIEDLQANGGK